jgi:KaiC/GvpD/RAD55 family RecA-like ATPase
MIGQLQDPKAIHKVGIYGMGGIGKTMFCQTLCNELSSEYDGRTCYIELKYQNSSLKKLLQKILIKLTRYNAEGLQQHDEGEVNSKT